MSRSKSNEIPHYELLYIVSNKYTEEEVKPIAEKVKKLISGNEGVITREEQWGKKKLAYPIQRFNFGYYNLLEFDIPASRVNKISRELRMSNEVLRAQIVAKKRLSSTEVQEAKKREEKRMEELAKKSKEEEKEIVKEKEKTSAKSKVDLKDLDEKLDKILDTDDLL